MIIGTVIGLIFFIAVGYFAYNFSQCIGTFTNTYWWIYSWFISARREFYTREPYQMKVRLHKFLRYFSKVFVNIPSYKEHVDLEKSL